MTSTSIVTKFIHLMQAMLLCSFTFPAVAAPDNPQLQSIMQQLNGSLLTLMPIVRGDGFEPEVFSREVKTMRRLVHKAEDHFTNQPIGAQITYDMFLNRIDDVDSYADSGSIMTARSLLSETFELCGSCHNQDQKSHRAFGISKLNQLDELLAADYSYLSRDYESALTSYKNYIAAEKSDTYKRTHALDRVLAITTGVYGNPQGARATLTAIQSNLITQRERVTVNDWLSALTLLDNTSIVSPDSTATIGELDHYLKEQWPSIQSLLNWNEQQVHWLMIGRKLNNLLQDNRESKNLPILLYWLAVSDRSTHYQFYESLSRQYLEQCIREFPKHPYARDCFDEYEMLMIVSFSGSGGINMPIALQTEINELRKLVHSR